MQIIKLSSGSCLKRCEESVKTDRNFFSPNERCKGVSKVNGTRGIEWPLPFFDRTRLGHDTPLPVKGLVRLLLSEMRTVTHSVYSNGMYGRTE